MSTEGKPDIKSQQDLFKKYKGKKAALYGLGTETGRALAHLDGYLEIIGLLDGFQEEGMFYEKPVISLREAADRAAVIIAVARPASCCIIAKRIGDVCRKSKIDLMDIRGKNLLSDESVSCDFMHIEGISKKELMQRIDYAETVSFDLFDTLVMRQTLMAEDVCRYVDCRLKDTGILIEDFCKKRIGAEKKLSQYSAPSLAEIYEEMLKCEPQTGITPENLAELEWQTDYGMLVPRKDVCSMLQYAYEKGKDVYVVSDSYYNQKKLEKILKKCGLTPACTVISSSDFKKSKGQGLFHALRTKIGETRWLHIGDDSIADIECAEKEGIKTCRLHSGFDLLEASGYLGLAGCMEDLSGRLKIGMFVSRVFNSPFQFETTDRKIRVMDAESIGYLFCAPLITEFIIWFRKKVRKYNLENIWFCARDGYFIRRLYQEVEPDQKSTYFLTSRTAAVRAGMEKDADIRYVESMKFSGSAKECVRERFGIEPAYDETDLQSGESGIMKYKSLILERACEARRNYMEYIDGLNTTDGDVAFFDFVAKGTVQMYMQRLTKHHLKGLYFLRLEKEQTEAWDLDIQSFYTKDEMETNAVFDNYYILETLLTAPFPSVQGFDSKGKPIYAKESRSEHDIQCFLRVQNGILEYFRTYLELCPAKEQRKNQSLDERFLSMIHVLKIEDEDFLNLVIEDPFFNRTTKVREIL